MGNEKQKQKLERLIKFSTTLLKILDDLDDECDSNIDQSLKLIDKCLDIALQNQKNRGKEFLSDSEIDNIVDKVYKEEGVKKFDDFKKEN